MTVKTNGLQVILDNAKKAADEADAVASKVSNHAHELSKLATELVLVAGKVRQVREAFSNYVKPTDPTEPTEPSENPTAAEMNKKLGIGINFGTGFEEPKNQDWGPEPTEEDVKITKSSGFKSVRLPIRWDDWSNDHAPFTIDNNFLKNVDKVVKHCFDAGLPVVINCHHFEELEGNPSAYKAKFVGIWKQLAEFYKDAPNDMLVFEFINEPDGRLKGETLSEIIEAATKEIRKTNPNRILMAGADINNAFEVPKGFKLPKDDKFIYSAHLYTPPTLSHRRLPYDDRPHNKWSGTDTEKRNIMDRFKKLEDWLKDNGNPPVNIGEYGISRGVRTNDKDSTIKWFTFVSDQFNARGWSTHLWDLRSRSFGIGDLNSLDADVLEAIGL